MSAKHESWGQGGPGTTHDRETAMTCTNRLLLALGLTAAVMGCTRAAGDSAVRWTGGAADERSSINPAEAQRLEAIECQAISQALRKHNFNRTETAKNLGISRRALLYKLQRLRQLGYEVDPQ